jgi:hypothetical protein
MEERRLRIVAARSGAEALALTIYMNEEGQLALLRALANLGPGNRHVHLGDLLTPAGPLDIAVADVVLTEGRADVAYAPPA